MAVTVKSPGVYIEEISVLPPSVAPVATAIPAFIGYTEKGPLATPTRIKTMLEFEQIFGGPFKETFAVTSTLSGGAYTFTTSVTPSKYMLYQSMQLFFANGGGVCYVASAGGYGVTVAYANGIDDCLTAIAKIDEVTLILSPEMIHDSANYGTYVNDVLAQCNKLQDRFGIFDNPANDVDSADLDTFRGTITSPYLKYGSVYMPFLNTTLTYGVDEAASAITGAISGTVGSQLPNIKSQVLTAIAKTRLTLPPSAAMAGVYSSVDRDRGVWKAPANVGLNAVLAPSIAITEAENGDMNITSTGKSINAIRAFAGKGTLVWGARTLAGNDNEWRYVNVRRLFNFMEESIKKATESVVFEPNDANTWLRVKGTITNFLTNLWRDGALVGAKPEQAFFVKVGLNETMTAQDILEGKLIVQIGAAASRPAEFIVLQFMHKLQES